MKDIIRAIIKEPGKEPEQITIANSLEAFQEAVGGYIENYALKDKGLIVCNEEGKLRGLEYNFHYDENYAPEIFVGTILVVGITEDEHGEIVYEDTPLTAEEFSKLIRDDIGAYYCEDCDLWFDEPCAEDVDLESFFGVGSMFPNHHYSTMFSCPFCHEGKIITKGDYFR